MSAKSFFDTNVLVYAYSSDEPVKRQQARKLFEESVLDKTAAISTQVVQEFCNVTIKKGVNTGVNVTALVEGVLSECVAQSPSIDFFLRSLRLQQKHKLSFYDALIIQAALDLNCDILYSEDLQAGQKFGSLTVVNPFAET